MRVSDRERESEPGGAARLYRGLGALDGGTVVEEGRLEPGDCMVVLDGGQGASSTSTRAGGGRSKSERRPCNCMGAGALGADAGAEGERSEPGGCEVHRGVRGVGCGRQGQGRGSKPEGGRRVAWGGRGIRYGLVGAEAGGGRSEPEKGDRSWGAIGSHWEGMSAKVEGGRSKPRGGVEWQGR